MPRLSTWFVRASLVYLAIGFTFGALMLANEGFAFFPGVWRFRSIHIETLLMGWFIQLAVGVAFWILPRFSALPSPRGKEQLVWLAFWLINLGIILISIDAFMDLPILVFIGRLAEIGGVLSFVIGSWKRVKSFGS